MRSKIILTIGLVTLSTGLAFSQINQSNGTIATTITPAATLPTGNVETFRFGSGLIRQLDKGSFDFTAASQWSSSGSLTTANQTLYGFRVQRAGRGLIFGYTGATQSATPTLGTPIIEWVGNNGISAGDLIFRTSASSTSTISTQVLKLRSDATAVLGTTSKYEDNTILSYPGYNSDRDFYPSPKLEINYLESEGLAVITDNAVNDFGRAAIFVNRSTVARGTSVGSTSNAQSAGGYSYAITSRATSNTIGVGTNYGLFIESSNGSRNFGVYARVAGSSSTSNFGLYGEVNGNSTAGTINYGVYGSATGNNAFAGYFSGRIFSTNSLVVSDQSLKTDIKQEENTLEKINSLNPVNYTFLKQKKEMRLDLSTNLQHGFIAQELEKIFPELVEEVTHPLFNDKGEQTGFKTLKSVNYIGLISVLTQSVKELNSEVGLLKEQLANANKTYVVNDSKNLNLEQLNNIVANGYYLGQNTPNPFNEFTNIDYSLPDNENGASIWILNLSGQNIKEYKLLDKKGTITISAGTLQQGIYLYSLISGGQEIITKKMVVK